MRHTLLLAMVFLVGRLAAGRGTQHVVAAAGPPDFVDVIARADPGLVRISTRTSRPTRNASRDDGVGGGFVISADGLIVTSRHVVSGAKRLIVTVPGRGVVDGEIVGTDEATDVALIRVPLKGLTPMVIGNPRNLRVGQWVLSGGSPYNLPNSWSVGIVSALGRSNVGIGSKALRDFIQTDAASNLGNSGGPLLNADGGVVGVMTAILSRTGGHQGVALAVPIDLAMQAVQRMRGGKVWRRPSLGVRVRELAARPGTPGGLAVSGFDPGSAAAAAGVRVGDVILTADGVAVRRSADLQRIVWARKTGDTVTLVIRRGNQRFKSPVVLTGK
jgi:serine protease Do